MASKNLGTRLLFIFLHEPSNCHNLNNSESKWINKLKAAININRTLLPKFF